MLLYERSDLYGFIYDFINYIGDAIYWTLFGCDTLTRTINMYWTDILSIQNS